MVKNTRFKRKYAYVPVRMSDGSWVFATYYLVRYFNGIKERKKDG